METKKQLEQIAERLMYALSIFSYECKVEIDYRAECITLVFSTDTDQITSSAIERFQSVVGEVGITVCEDHVELYGFPILIP